MATETEVERLVTRLIGDATGLKKAVNEGIAHIKSYASQVQASLAKARTAAKESNALFAEGARVAESVKTPLQRYNQEMDRLGFLLKKGAIDQNTYELATKKATAAIKQEMGVTQGLIDKLSKVGFAMTAVGVTMSAVFGRMAIFSLRQAASFESTNIAFETMLGSAEEAKKLLADLTTFAIKTPYEMPAILQATRGLVQFGERGEELMETLEILGNAASGTSTDFGMLALIFNQIRGVGKLLTQDFRQLSTRGVISLQDIADHFGVATEEAQKMLSEGKISFKDVRDLLKALSSEGGRFANMMEKQSKSLGGLWSTLTDNLNIMQRQIGQAMAPAVKKAVEGLIAFTEVLGELPSWVRTLAGAVIGLGAGVGILLTSLGGLILLGPQLAIAYTTATAALSGLLAAAAAAAPLLILGAALAYGVYQLWRFVTASSAYKQALEGIAQASQKVIELEQKRTRKAIAESTGFSNAADPAMEALKKRTILEDRLAEVLKKQQAAAKEAARLGKEFSDVGFFEARAAGFRHALGGTTRFDLLREKIAALKQETSSYGDQVEELVEELRKLENAAEEALSEANEQGILFVKNLQMQRATLGMSADEAKIYQMRLMGVNQEIINAALAQARWLAQEKAQLDKQREINSVLSDMYTTMRRIGMTAEQIQLDKLRMMGATPEQIAYAERLLAITKARADHLKAIEDAKAEAERKAKEAKMEEERAHKALVDRAKSIIEENKTAIEKARDRVNELNKLARKGLIDPVTYRRAMNTIREDLKKLKDDSKLDLSFEYEGLAAGGFQSEMQIRKQIAFVRNKQEEQKELKKIEVNTGRMAAAMERRPIVVAPADLGSPT